MGCTDTTSCAHLDEGQKRLGLSLQTHRGRCYSAALCCLLRTGGEAEMCPWPCCCCYGHDSSILSRGWGGPIPVYREAGAVGGSSRSENNLSHTQTFRETHLSSSQGPHSALEVFRLVQDETPVIQPCLSVPPSYRQALGSISLATSEPVCSTKVCLLSHSTSSEVLHLEGILPLE